jgi:hypothetical protein
MVPVFGVDGCVTGWALNVVAAEAPVTAGTQSTTQKLDSLLTLVAALKVELDEIKALVHVVDEHHHGGQH